MNKKLTSVAPEKVNVRRAKSFETQKFVNQRNNNNKKKRKQIKHKKK
jgi:hypothetical protein